MRLRTATAAAALAGIGLAGTAGNAVADENAVNDATRQAASAAQITAENLLPKEGSNTLQLGDS